MCVWGGKGRYACQRGLDAFFSVTFQYEFKKFQLSRSKPPDPPPLNTHILAWVVSRVKCLKSRRFFFKFTLLVRERQPESSFHIRFI